MTARQFTRAEILALPPAITLADLGRCLGRSEPVIRCADVPAATRTISDRNAAVRGNERSTTPMTRLTAASCAAARRPA